MSMLWTAVMGMVVRSTKPYPELAAPGNGATRRRSIRTNVAPGSKPRSASAAVPDGPDWLVPLLLTGMLAPFLTGCLWRSCSAVVPAPDLLIRSRLRLNTGFGPTSSAVGIFEPVTITRSTSAAPGAGAAAAPGGGGGGAGFCANALAAITNGTPTAPARATRTYPNVLNTFLIIGFSMGLVRFSARNY